MEKTKINIKNWQNLNDKEELFNEFKELIKNTFPYEDLEFFDRDDDNYFNIRIERKLISAQITEIEINTIIKEFVMQLRKKYIDSIKAKAKKEMIIEDFKKQVFPQSVDKEDNLLFCCFNIPIGFQDLNIFYDDDEIIIDANISIVDDLIENNIAVLKEN